MRVSAVSLLSGRAGAGSAFARRRLVSGGGGGDVPRVDRNEKILRYAQTQIPEVWLIEVEQGTVTQYTQPDGTRYRRVQTLARGQFLSADILGPLHLAIDSIFG
jgi:hypothetical protein